MVNASAPLHDATPAFQLKGGSFTGTVLELHSTDLTLVAARSWDNGFVQVEYLA